MKWKIEKHTGPGWVSFTFAVLRGGALYRSRAFTSVDDCHAAMDHHCKQLGLDILGPSEEEGELCPSTQGQRATS
jgi:hypothetical protein